jgi:hypothetical protein
LSLNTIERSFRVEGPEGLGPRPRPELIGPLLSNLHGSLLDAVRMGFRHSSRARGRVPGVLRAAADVRFVGHEGDGERATVLHFVAPDFGSVAGELFRQRSLWDDGPKPHETAFDLFGAALRDVGGRREDSDAFDRGLLRRIHSYRKVLLEGVQRVEMPDTPVDRQGRIDEDVVDAARQLMAATPRSRRVRVAGRLDVMGVSQSVMKLEVQPHVFVTAVWEGEQAVDAFKALLNREIVLEGMGIFRPSGSLLRVDTDTIVPATPEDEFFRKVPVGTVSRDYPRLARLTPGEKSAYRHLLGSIPPEESDEEFEAALAALR